MAIEATVEEIAASEIGASQQPRPTGTRVMLSSQVRRAVIADPRHFARRDRDEAVECVVNGNGRELRETLKIEELGCRRAVCVFSPRKEARAAVLRGHTDLRREKQRAVQCEGLVQRATYGHHDVQQPAVHVVVTLTWKWSPVQVTWWR